MQNLKDSELNKVSGGIEDDVLLTWMYHYQRYTLKKIESTQLSKQYSLSDINFVREYIKNDCKKSHVFFISLFYKDPASGTWVEVDTE